MIKPRRLEAIIDFINVEIENQDIFEAFIAAAFDLDNERFISIILGNRVWLAIW